MASQVYTHVKHEFEPVFDEESRILILGTLPSVKSREQQFYYGHKQNRFWKVLAAICGDPVPAETDEKKEFLLKNHIAVWDVIAECMERGVLVLSAHGKVRLLPALNIPMDLLEKALDVLVDVLGKDVS